MPEWPLTALDAQTPLRDLSPIPAPIGGTHPEPEPARSEAALQGLRNRGRSLRGLGQEERAARGGRVRVSGQDRLTIGNVDAADATVSLTDPLTGADPGARIVSPRGEQVVQLQATDSWRLLTIDD